MSEDDHPHHHHHHHHHKTHHILEKMTSKISSIKEDVVDAIKERTHSTSSSDRRNSLSANNNLQDDLPSPTLETNPSFRGYGDNESIGSASSLAPLVGATQAPPMRHTIDQLAMNMGFGGIRPAAVNLPSPTSDSIESASSLLHSSVSAPRPVQTPSSSQLKFEPTDETSLDRAYLDESEDDMKERIITQIDPEEMVAESVVVNVPTDPVRRAAVLLAGSKFELKSSEMPTGKVTINTDTIYSVAIVVGVLSLILALWKPISSYFSGLMVGILFAGALYYIFVRVFISTKAEENAIEEWVDFPALEAMLLKCDKEDKETNIRVTGAMIAFQSYDADRDDDFVRYPCDLRLDGYRLIITLASKNWGEDKKSEKEVKFVGYREYLIKEARMILVPEATLTRAKYWMNDYPMVIHDLQILDKQINSKQQLEKSKLDTNDFFTNTATVLSIWFETSPQKEEWFHKVSLVLRKGKEEIERKNSLYADNISLSSTVSNSTLHHRLARTESDTEMQPIPVTESDIRTSIIETQNNAEELQQKAKIIEPASEEIDASGTHRAAARKSKKRTPNEASLQKVLKSPECLDEAAITINFMARRLLCDMFDVPVFKDLLKTKVEMKLKEVAVSILENLRVTSIDLGNTFPVILKIEPMQWNTQGIWINVFLYYRGSFKLSVKTRVLLQKLINYDPKKDKPIFAQHHSAQLVHEDDERIDEDDLVQRQKLLAKEPEIPEMAVTRKLGLALTSLAMNKYFQMFANIPYVKRLMEKFSEDEVGANVEVTSFSGVLTLNIPPPPSDRIWVGFPEMPDLNIKVVPTYGEKQYAYTLLQDFLSARIRAELKRLVVLPAMDDQLLPFFRDWVIDVIGEIVAKPVNPLTDNYKTKLNAQAAVRAGLEEYGNARDLQKQTSTTSTTSESTRL